MIKSMWCGLVFCFLSFQRATQRLNIFIFELTVIKCRSHWRMQRCDVITSIYMRVKHGDITKANYPFRIFFKMLKIQLVNDPAGSVTATSAKYGLNLWVVEHLLQVFYPFIICT